MSLLINTGAKLQKSHFFPVGWPKPAMKPAACVFVLGIERILLRHVCFLACVLLNGREEANHACQFQAIS
jgi:hypothetical protein